MSGKVSQELPNPSPPLTESSASGVVFHGESSFPLSTSSSRALVQRFCLEKTGAVYQTASNLSPKKLTSLVTKPGEFQAKALSRILEVLGKGTWEKSQDKTVGQLVCSREPETKTAVRSHPGVKTNITHRPQKLFC